MKNRTVGIIAALVSGCFLGCAPIMNSRLTEAPSIDRGKPIKQNCFRSLIAGPLESTSKLASVTFATGPCQGQSKAIADYIDAKEIIIELKGEASSSPLFVRGQKIMALHRGKQIHIANFSPRADDAELQLLSSFQVSAINQPNGRAIKIQQK